MIIAHSNPNEDLLLNTYISIIFSNRLLHTSTGASCHFINPFSNKYFRSSFSILSMITDTSFLIYILHCAPSKTTGTDEWKITASYNILKDKLALWLPTIASTARCLTNHLCSAAASHLKAHFCNGGLLWCRAIKRWMLTERNKTKGRRKLGFLFQKKFCLQKFHLPFSSSRGLNLVHWISPPRDFYDRQ